MKANYITAISILIVTGTTFAQNAVETKSAPPPFEAKVGPATINPSATTTYTQPGTGPSGNPIPGNQRGSSDSTSYGATVTIPIPEGKQK